MQSKNLGWAHLTDIEKSVLTLITVNERSKKEAAIILNLSYYKFSEIYSRARRLFILFKDYYDKYGSITPPKGLAFRPEYKILFPLLLRDRMSLTQICKQVPELVSLNKYNARKEFWETLFSSADPENPHHSDFLNLVREFDRWNSSRILPSKLRKPSAFIRRKNAVYKKAIDTLVSYSEMSWEMLLGRFSTSAPPFYYVPIVLINEGYFKVERVIKKDKVKKYLTDNYILCFETEENALKIAEVIFDYKSMAKPSPYMAHKFWAEVRLLFLKASNYKGVLGVENEDFLDLAAKDRDFISKSKAKKSKKIRIGLSRSEIFWG